MPWISYCLIIGSEEVLPSRLCVGTVLLSALWGVCAVVLLAICAAFSSPRGTFAFVMVTSTVNASPLLLTVPGQVPGAQAAEASFPLCFVLFHTAYGLFSE